MNKTDELEMSESWKSLGILSLLIYILIHTLVYVSHLEKKCFSYLTATILGTRNSTVKKVNLDFSLKT